jgi:YVTN family beta-propeller protein
MFGHARALAVTALLVAAPAAYAVEVGVVPNTGSDTISFVDVGTNAVLGTIPIGNRPTTAAIHPDGSTAWVARPSRCPRARSRRS